MPKFGIQINPLKVVESNEAAQFSSDYDETQLLFKIEQAIGYIA